MANLKEIRNRINSVGSTMQITSAMKMVSAAKLKRAQDAITQMRPYAEKLQEILGNLSASLDISENAYADDRGSEKTIIVAITSNRGLCGGFNNNIIKYAKKLAETDYKGNVTVLPIGKKASDFFKKTNYAVKDSLFAQNYNELFNSLNFEDAANVANIIMQAFIDKKIDRVIIVYNQFKNAATQIIKEEQFLPIKPTVEETGSTTGDYIFDPSKLEIVEELIPKSLKIQFYKALLDSHAAEHGARMTAMHKATDNASELKKSLTLSYNKARQAAITNEILEIVSGAEALEA